MVHNYYLTRSGEDVSMEAEVRLLRDRGCDVETFEERNESIFLRSQVPLALGTIWSHPVYRAIRERIRRKRYDVVHVQNFFPLISPAVYYAAKAEGVAVVQSLRNYRLMCPSANFFRDGHPCEDCRNRFVPWPAVVHACYKDSRKATSVVAATLTVHRILRSWAKKVDVFIVASSFLQTKFIEGGFSADRIVVSPNFVYPDPGRGEGRGGYALFVGRLSPEKGIEWLLSAWNRLDCRIPLKIAGEGPLSRMIEDTAQQRRGLEWLGACPLSDTYDLMGDAAFLVVPSNWYEPFGRVVIEAFAKGTPVLTSRLGALAELIDDGRTGLFFRGGNVEDLVAKVEWMSAHSAETAKMRDLARKEFEAKYTGEHSYHQLMRAYHQAIEEDRNSR